jgi:predicted peptidase
VTVAVALHAPTARSAGTPLTTSLARTFDAGSTYFMPYRLFLPPDLATASDKFPLVIFLHGAGEQGTNNVDQVATHIGGLWSAVRSPEYEAFMIAPQSHSGGWNPSSPYDRTMEIINSVIAEYPQIDTNRIYLTGLSMGGYGTFNYLQAYPDFFAAAVPMSGGGSPSKAFQYKDVPIWVFHGSADATVPVTQSQAMVAALKAAGGSPLYTEIAGGAHNIWDITYADGVIQQYGLYDWMFAQTLAVPEPATLGSAALSAMALAGVSYRTRRQRNRKTGRTV